MNYRLLVMVVMALLLVIVVGFVLNYDNLPNEGKETMRQFGYHKTMNISGVEGDSFIFQTDNKFRLYINCTSEKEVFNMIVVEIDGREKSFRNCNSRNKLVAIKDGGEHRISILPSYDLNIGRNNLTTWNIEVWEKW